MLTFTSEEEDFLSRYLEALRRESASLFVGAGISRGADLVDWAGLLAGLAREIGLDVQREHDRISLAQYHVNKYNRNRLNEAIIDKFSEGAHITSGRNVIVYLQT